MWANHNGGFKDRIHPKSRKTPRRGELRSLFLKTAEFYGLIQGVDQCLGLLRRQVDVAFIMDKEFFRLGAGFGDLEADVIFVAAVIRLEEDLDLKAFIQKQDRFHFCLRI